MQRIIDGCLFEGKQVPGAWEVRTKRCNGVMERTARPLVAWEDTGVLCKPYVAETPEIEAENELAAKEKNRNRAARRARIACKWFIVHERFDELLTLTYRDNQQDVELFKVHFAQWVRRMKKALPGFRYCAGFEPQDRGAWHAHVATQKLPTHAEYKGVKIQAWRLGTEIWRDVVGPAADGKPGGLCFVGGKPSRWGNRRRNMGLYKLASYVSKYIVKHYELCPDEKNRYSRSNGQAQVDVEVVHLANCYSLAELVGAIFEQCEGAIVVSHRVNKFNDFYVLATEAGQGPPNAL